MKSELEPQDIQSIAEEVARLLKPLLPKNGRHEEETIFDVKGLAAYLKVDVSWVYKQVSYKAIPYFKSGKYTRFKKSTIDRWIDGQSVNPIPPLRLMKKFK